MKVQKSSELSAFGGMNFVFDFLESRHIGHLFYQNLPRFIAQSKYNWKDIIYSLLSIYMCGGDCIEDLSTHLKPHFKGNPFFKMPSPDTVLRRISELAQPNKTCQTTRGSVRHSFNTNQILDTLNMKLLKSLGVFQEDEFIIDYDNTILFSEKNDCSMTYKRGKGYQPGVCTINENNILYLENRNGNSDAKSFQHDTIKRILDLLELHLSKKPDHFRADAASYQYEVVKLLDERVDKFYIGCRNSYVEKYFSCIDSWTTTTDTTDEKMEIGEIMIKPFRKQSTEPPKEYRLVVKRKANKSGQVDIFTNDDFEYRAILTNNFTMNAVELARFYNHRGNMEKQFDILKNDFGWNNMPFSRMNHNTVFLYLMAMCRNLYNAIIKHFAEKVKGLKPHFRLKKFIFRFIILPAKWIMHSRQKQLKIYGRLNYFS